MFKYNNKQINTQDKLIISVADLRDLVNAGFMADAGSKKAEISLVLQCIQHKNNLKADAISIGA